MRRSMEPRKKPLQNLVPDSRHIASLGPFIKSLTDHEHAYLEDHGTW